MAASSDNHSLVRHPVYYRPDGTRIFRVEQTLYKLDEELLALHVDIRRASASANPSLGRDMGGDNDENPVVLDDVRADVFDLFLEYVYGHERTVTHDCSHEELYNLLAFADHYHCSGARRFAVGRIWDAGERFHPAELVHIGSTFKIGKLFKLGFKRLLLDTSPNNMTERHQSLIGHSTFVTLVYAQSVLDEHRRILAAEEPPITSHAEDCRDPTVCAEDWHSTWWNGMGRFLLDGNKPLSFRDAAQRFKTLQFGRMNEGCKMRMLQILDGGAGFQHAEAFIRDICDGVAHDMHISDE